MKVAIIGTRGIPNNWGGFEQCAEYLALGMVARGIDTTVYNWHDHPYQEKEWKGVKIVHCYSPYAKIGEPSEFIYDLNCVLDSRKRDFDVILQLGYTSNSIWRSLYAKSAVITTNMDGFEWQRTRRSKPARTFIKWSESVAAKNSDFLIADSPGIKTYLHDAYGRDSVYIPYGAIPFDTPDPAALAPYGLRPQEYDMLIARILPENSIEMILDGVAQSGSKRDFLVIGGHDGKYGQYLKDKFKGNTNIRFIGGIYDIGVLNNLRYHSNLYFHGHTVGGTNPSLLEAMASHTLICANRNVYNQAILGDDAYYFQNSGEVADYMTRISRRDHEDIVATNYRKIIDIYSWDIITEQYLAHFREALEAKKGGRKSDTIPNIG